MNTGRRTLILPTVRGCCRALLCALAAVLFIAPAPSSADEIHGTYVGGGLGQGVSFVRNDAPRGAWAGTLRFQIDDGGEILVFCIQLDVGTSPGNRYRGAGAVEELRNGCQLRYILDNLPGSTASTAEEAAARQMAIWHFSDDVDLSTITDDHQALRERALAIADAAVAGPCPRRRTTPPDLRFQPPSLSSASGQRVTYVLSAGDLDAGQTVHVALTGQGVLDNGTRQADLVLDGSGATTVGLTSTGVGTTTVTADLPYRLEAGTVLSQLDESQPTQRLVMAEHSDLVAHAAAETVWLDVPTATAQVPTPTATSVPPSATPQPSATIVTPAAPTVVVAASLTPTAPAHRTSGPHTPVPGVAATPTRVVQQPAALPRTGAPGDPPWLIVALAALLLGVIADALVSGVRTVH
jgi:hypothetical protein